jgi:FixJ family two-component response regulator
MSESEAVVFVVDDDASVRTSTERLVRSIGFRVQTFVSAREFLDGARSDGPACLVLDIQLPGPSGLDLQRELGRAGIHMPIIFVTGHADVPTTVRAMKAGAVEFLTKPYRRQALIDAVRGAIERDRVARRERSAATVLRERYEHLTPREREVMTFVVAGLLNKQIAAELDTTERTIKFHRAHIMEKMAAASLPELVRMAAQLDGAAKR